MHATRQSPGGQAVVCKTHCLGKRVSGVFVIYVPYASFTGNDAVRYTVTGPTAHAHL